MSVSELAKGYIWPVQPGLFHTKILVELASSHENEMARPKLNLISRFKSIQYTPVNASDLFQIDS